MSSMSPDSRHISDRIDEGSDNERMLKTIFQLQQQLIERDAIIHDLHHKAHIAQEDESRKLEIKKGFSVIEKRHVDTTDTGVVLRDSMHHLVYTLVDTFGGCAGVLLLDVPYNLSIGASNHDLKTHRLLRSYWEERPSLSSVVLKEFESLRLYRDVITQKKGKVYGEWETGVIKDDVPILRDMRRLMAVPVVVDGVSIAVVVMVNGVYTDRDPPLVKEVLAELWTSNVQPLINIALDTQRKKETESKLVTESLLRDEIILSLDTILDDVVKQALSTTPQGRSTSEHLWRMILQRVADFFEEYFGSDAIVAVTNTEANFRIQNLHFSANGSTCNGSRRGAHSVDLSGDLQFIHYVFSESLRHVRKTKMRNLSHPNLKDAKLMREVMSRGEPFYSPNCKGIKFPCGHMKMNCLLLVPILFCEEPVGMLGLANGDFSISSGRILQSVFTTFWSMIVKATIMSESQKVLNAALPVPISERVKNGEKIADSYPTATVLFADIVGFTEFSKELAPYEVVEYSNLIFARLDELVQQSGLEKIKVIGDCYMVAGGLQDKSGKCPSKVGDRAAQSQMREIVNFGMRILDEARLINGGVGDCSEKIREKLKKTPLQFRIGISEGPLTAGVFGTGKVQYDVLGATVNLASRLESSGRPGAIQVSSSIYDELGKIDKFKFEKRKPICLKGLGLRQTYFLLSNGESSTSASNLPYEVSTTPSPSPAHSRARTASPPAVAKLLSPTRVPKRVEGSYPSSPVSVSPTPDSKLLAG
eukprot:TRINITY_DN1454_c0_g3_i1.p1 TRINITY_DN1454_c0_g3~~TRINITY_DN1454_c0_g3_i1.p1  ORF type:complete len:760 (+),score=342.33 TRINITY_DN1454_c0_g3_i1:185-2464(+)